MHPSSTSTRAAKVIHPAHAPAGCPVGSRFDMWWTRAASDGGTEPRVAMSTSSLRSGNGFGSGRLAGAFAIRCLLGERRRLADGRGGELARRLAAKGLDADGE